MNVMRLFAEPTLAKFPITHAVDGTQDGGIGVTSMLCLPTAFGEIYMGQTFNCYVNVANNSNGDIEIVRVQAELSFQVLRGNGSKSVKKVELQDARKIHSRNPAQASIVHKGSVVNAGKSIDLLIEHALLEEEYLYALETPKTKKSPRVSDSKLKSSPTSNRLKRESTFTLLVTVIYRGLNAVDDGTAAVRKDRRLKRTFRFGVRKPFHIKYRTSIVGERTLVEAQLQNLCSTPVVVRDISFAPSPGYKLLPLHPGDADDQAQGRAESKEETKGDLSEDSLLQSPTTRSRSQLDAVVQKSIDSLQSALVDSGGMTRRIFVLVPAADPADQADFKNDKEAPKLGSVRVDWSGPMGERSRLSFAPLKCSTKSALVVEVTARLEDPTTRIVFGQPFTVILSIRNKSKVTMNLSLRVPMSTFAPIAPVNMLQEQLGELPTQAAVERRVEMIPLAYGQHKLEGIVVMDAQRTKYLARPLSVFVESE